MPLYRIQQKNMLFVHIPKTGGTSFETVFQNAGSQALFSDKRTIGLRCTPQHFHGEILKNIMQREFIDYCFTVVRHPIDRIKSEFFYRCSDEKFRYFSGLRRKKVKISEAAPDKVCKAFSGWLDKTLSKYPKNSFILGNHIRPQIEYTSAFDPEIFKFEDGLQRALDKVGEMIGERFAPMPHSNAAKKKADFEISKADMLTLKEFYAADFEAFGYTA